MRTHMLLLVIPATACFSEPADEIRVTLTLEDEDVRSLPIIASGATSLLGLDVADSHGRLRARVDVEGADDVDFRGLRLTFSVNGAQLESQVVRKHVAGADLQTGLADSVLRDGDVVTVELRAKELAQIALPVGATYSARIELDWREHTLERIREQDTATLAVDEVIAAPVNVQSFAPRASPAPSVSAPQTSASFSAAAEITSGLDVDVKAARAKITYFGADALVPALGLALFNSGVATTVAGQAVGTTGPGDVLAIEASSGTAASTGSVAGGKAVVAVEIDYDVVDATPGLATDLLHFVVSVP